MRTGLLIVLALGLSASVPASAQNGRSATPKSEDTLNNASVIAMAKAKLPDDLIIAKIESSPGNYDVTTNGLVQLSNAKVSTTVIKAMLARSSTKAPTPDRAVPALAGAPSSQGSSGRSANVGSGAMDGDLELPTEPGIYVYADSAGKKIFTMLEPTAYTQGKTGNRLKSMLTYGIAHSTLKAVLRGESAAIGTQDDAPTFYFIFEKTNAGLSGTGSFFGSGVTSPNEFSLIQLRVADGGRETTVLSQNAFGASSGTSDKAIVPFSFIKLRPGVYRVRAKASLEPGEYCFLSAAGFQAPAAGAVGAATANRLWDFSIRDR